MFLIFTTQLYQYFNVYFLFALFSDEPEVFLPKYSQTAIFHAAHFRKVVKALVSHQCRPPRGGSPYKQPPHTARAPSTHLPFFICSPRGRPHEPSRGRASLANELTSPRSPSPPSPDVTPLLVGVDRPSYTA